MKCERIIRKRVTLYEPIYRNSYFGSSTMSYLLRTAAFVFPRTFAGALLKAPSGGDKLRIRKSPNDSIHVFNIHGTGRPVQPQKVYTLRCNVSAARFVLSVSSFAL